MNKNQGFTLIELLVVVLIIGILSAVALPQYQKVVDKTRLTQALTWGKTIRDAEKIYHMANSAFTQNLEDLDISLPKCTAEEDVGHYICEGGWRVFLTTVPSVYVSLPAQFTGDKRAGVEYYFTIDRRLCYANSSSERFIRVCESYGGTLFAEKPTEKFYTLP